MSIEYLIGGNESGGNNVMYIGIVVWELFIDMVVDVFVGLEIF